MQLKDITLYINKCLAGEMLTYGELKFYLDKTIDDINGQLNSKYPAFSDSSITSEYTAFPDQWIRSVVIPGAAWYYYVSDEEGSPAAIQYQNDYQRGLFYMLRDMIYNVPVEYQADSVQGSASTTFGSDMLEYDSRGVW